jgi:hypothetical protein
MSSAVMTHAQAITQPLEGLHGNVSQLAAKHREANDQLHSYANDLLSSGTSDSFVGAGATAFLGLVSYYVDTSEKHMQALDDAANAVRTCYSNVMDATYTASSAGPHDGLTHKVLKQVTHDDIIQNGDASIHAIVSHMTSTLHDMKHTAGSFFGHVFTGHFGDAFGDLGREFSDVGKLVGDVTSLLQHVGHVLGQWASAIRDAVGNCLKVVGSVLWNVVDFVFDFSGIINDVKTLFDPKVSFWDKVWAAGDLVLNVGTDVLMVTGIGEELRAGQLLAKGATNIGKRAFENGGKQFIKDAGEQLLKSAVKGGAEALKFEVGGAIVGGASGLTYGITHDESLPQILATTGMDAWAGFAAAGNLSSGNRATVIKELGGMGVGTVKYLASDNRGNEDPFATIVGMGNMVAGTGSQSEGKQMNFADEEPTVQPPKKTGGNGGGDSGRSRGKFDQIFNDPEQLRDKTPDEIREIAQQEGWDIGTLGKGSHKGQGLVVREVDENGNLTGKMIQWHPGGGHHGSEPYWKVSSGLTGTTRIGPQFDE